MTTSIAILCALLVIACAAGDRISGSGKFGHTTPMWITAAVLAAAVAFLTPWSIVVSVIFGLCFFIWRNPAWAIFGGAIDPSGTKQIVGTFARHALVLFWVVPAVMVGLPVIPVVISSLVFAVFATGLGVYNHKQFAAGVDVNDKIEIVRGAALGVALSVGFFF